MSAGLQRASQLPDRPACASPPPRRPTQAEVAAYSWLRVAEQWLGFPLVAAHLALPLVATFLRATATNNFLLKLRSCWQAYLPGGRLEWKSAIGGETSFVSSPLFFSYSSSNSLSLFRSACSFHRTASKSCFLSFLLSRSLCFHFSRGQEGSRFIALWRAIKQYQLSTVQPRLPAYFRPY